MSIRWTLPGLLVCSVAVGLIASVSAARSGPCAAQIATLEQEIKITPVGPQSGPTYSQTLGAQLHHQPTPGDVEHAEHIANTEADAALDAARKADAAGDDAGCNASLEKAKRLYGIAQ